jgi:hypothetical protein
MMKKYFLCSALLLAFLGGCSFDGSSSPTLDMDTVVNSGADILSGVWNTTKEVSKEFYEDQIKPTVDTAIDSAQQELEKLKQEAKDQYNQQIDKLKVE